MGVHKRKDTKKASYQARWRDPAGEIKARDFKTKADAERYLVQMKANIARADYADPKLGKTKIKDVYQDWHKSITNLKPKSVEAYESVWRCLVLPYWGERSVNTINRSQIKTWLTDRKSSTGLVISSSRMNQAYVLLKQLLDHAVDMNLVVRNPIQSGSGLKLKNILPSGDVKENKRVLTIDELISLSKAVQGYEVMILLAGLVGLRWAELISLTPNDFDFRKRTISINKSTTEVNGHFATVLPKSGLSRLLPIPNPVLKDLKELVLSTDANTPVFRSPKGGYIRHSNFSRRIFHPALKELGIEDFTFHSLRHTAISLAIASGVDILAVSKIAGHATPAITLSVYGHEFSDSLDSFTKAIDENFLHLEAL